MHVSARTARIRDLNDRLRTTFDPTLGRIMVTVGVNTLDAETKKTVLDSVRAFDAFTPDNDPHGEHDFGNFEIEGERFFWKVDYDAPTLDAGSDDPSDPAQTTRVLTIMHASEY